MDKIKNETKNITTERYNIIGELNKMMQSPEGMIKFIRRIELKIIIKGRFYKDKIYHFLQCENNPISWKKIFHENRKR